MPWTGGGGLSSSMLLTSDFYLRVGCCTANETWNDVDCSSFLVYDESDQR